MMLAILAVLCAQEPSECEALLQAAKLKMSEAMDKAMSEAKTGVVIKAILEEDENGVVFSFDIAQGKNVLAINLDAKTGKVVESDVEEGNDQSALAGGKLTMAQAMEAAVKAVPGTVMEAALKPDGRRIVATVAVYDGKKVCRVQVDMNTGQASGAQEDRAFTETFDIDPKDWSTTGRNPYFILEPGWTLILEGKEGKTVVRLVITVLEETIKVDGVETRIVEEREWEDGELIEVSRNFFAICRRTNGVYYFGEDVDIYKNGKVVGHSGAWKSGEKGAKFGLMMPGTPLLGARYYQEIAPGVAMDRAEVVGLGEAVETPAGKFEKCLRTLETTPLEKGARDFKLYAPGVGLIVDGPCRLVKSGRGIR